MDTEEKINVAVRLKRAGKEYHVNCKSFDAQHKQIWFYFDNDCGWISSRGVELVIVYATHLDQSIPLDLKIKALRDETIEKLGL